MHKFQIKFRQIDQHKIKTKFRIINTTTYVQCLRWCPIWHRNRQWARWVKVIQYICHHLFRSITWQWEGSQMVTPTSRIEWEGTTHMLLWWWTLLLTIIVEWWTMECPWEIKGCLVMIKWKTGNNSNRLTLCTTQTHGALWWWTHTRWWDRREQGKACQTM